MLGTLRLIIFHPLRCSAGLGSWPFYGTGYYGGGLGRLLLIVLILVAAGRI